MFTNHFPPHHLFIHRWFKHISDAADAYKARTKGSHEYAEDATGAGAGSAGHPPKDTFETVTESQKIEQISATPLDPRLERKDSSQQCRAISTGGPGSGPSIGHSTSNASTGSAGSNNNNEDSLPNKNRAAANESDDNVENEEKEKVKRRSQFGGSSQDGGDDDDLQKPPVAGGDDDRSAGHHYRGRGQGCALTQQCSLVAPSEIHVSVSSALTAEPILTPTGKHCANCILELDGGGVGGDRGDVESTGYKSNESMRRVCFVKDHPGSVWGR